MSRLILLTIIIIIVLITARVSSKQNVKSIPSIVTQDFSRKDVYLGAWVQNFWDNDKKKLTTSTLTDFQLAIDKKMALANIYSEWEYLANPELLTSLQEIYYNGWTPIISSNPYFFDECREGKDNLYTTIATGSCDTFLRSAAKNLKAFNKPLFFRFAWEMNLPDMYWSVDRVKSTPQDFTTAWRKFHTIMKEEKADNVIWVLSFNQTNSNSIPYQQLYPGDEYVDWVAIDGYNWGNTHEWSGWASFDGVFRNSYNELLAVTKTKPVMISEVNSAPTGTGGDKALWLKDMLEVQIPKHYTHVEAVVFFNENKTGGEKIDWRLEVSDEYVKAVKNSLVNPLYQSTYP